MGNLQQQCRGTGTTELELNRKDAIYVPNETLTGTVSYLKHAEAFVVLTGVIYFKKRKKAGLEKCEVTFFTVEYPLKPNHSKSQQFQLQLDDRLPPSFNEPETYPSISYTVRLVYKKAKEQIHSSIPIRVCPHVQIDRPLLLTPLFFGPIENHQTGIKLDVKVNRAIFTFDDIIQIFYELQNPNQEFIHKTEISLGIYYTIESNVSQEDICIGFESFENTALDNKLIRNKALLNIPEKIYLPPTYKFQYGRDGERSSFNLTIDYKIQFRIYFGNEHTMWQVDIPIILCNETIQPRDNEMPVESKETISNDANITNKIVS
ncbi:unnamed protein product [Adineta ricciae]|uniref:Arrestin C-terminal-like domain-containing protein n=1 Tax=Adineta ricciae TaxID=249248 RepID=A0A813XZ41_ADIRI|nr:unnamed protein product [Adineta ricciae]CAF1339186.1 unnamed protein product [Adineta ricciae]